MFRITEDPSSGSLVKCLAKNYKNDSIVSVDMHKVRVVTALFCSILWMLILVTCSQFDLFLLSFISAGSSYSSSKFIK